LPEEERLASDVISAYRRRRERMIPLLLGSLAVVLLVVGLFLIVVWFTGDNPPRLPALFATDSPTPSSTPTLLPPSATPTITLTPEPSLTPTPEGPLTYIVEQGDTLFSIAQQFGVSMDVLIAANQLANPDNIPVGTELTIPGAEVELPTATPLPETLVPGTRIEYVVKTGDNLQSIALRFNSTVDAIVRANPGLKPADVLFVGRRLLVPVNIVTPVPTNTVDPNATPSATPRP
jgi:LysM repeat protein